MLWGPKDTCVAGGWRKRWYHQPHICEVQRENGKNSITSPVPELLSSLKAKLRPHSPGTTLWCEIYTTKAGTDKESILLFKAHCHNITGSSNTLSQDHGPTNVCPEAEIGFLLQELEEIFLTNIPTPSLSLLPKIQLPSCWCSYSPGPEQFWSVRPILVNHPPIKQQASGHWWIF